MQKSDSKGWCCIVTCSNVVEDINNRDNYVAIFLITLFSQAQPQKKNLFISYRINTLDLE